MELEVYLAKKSASKAEIAKKTGISKSRISELTLNLYPTKVKGALPDCPGN
ncbi:MAG: hypothetical protein M9954_07145 [Cyclobacteriaceae bacterium]|nr:hypothetical protein [Cyclobacteriaceae bacterium]